MPFWPTQSWFPKFKSLAHVTKLGSDPYLLLLTIIYFQEETCRKSTINKYYPGGHEVLRQAYLKKGLPHNAAETIMASITDRTWRQYDKAIHLWWKFCQERSLPLYEPESANAIEFFSQQKEKVKMYSTLNIYRAVISILMSNRRGKDSDVSRFFRGVANKTPVRSRYTHSWDLSTLLDHLATWMPNEELTLAKLTKKLVTLLAIRTAQRAETLIAIRLADIMTIEDLIKIHIADMLKTSRHLKEQPVLNTQNR